MTDEQWEKIRPFAEAEARARLKYEAWSMTNSNQPTERQRIEVMVEYRRAVVELNEASAVLARALQEAGL
jgi:hypothetical protein